MEGTEKGDFVEYVGPHVLMRWDPCGGFRFLGAPAPGFVARIDGIEDGPCPCCGDPVALIIQIEGFGPRWCRTLWRPVLRPKPEILESLLAPSPPEPTKAPECVGEPA